MSVPTLEAGPLAGLWIVTFERVRDERGWFARVFDEDVFARHGLHASFPQHGEAHNERRSTLRGLHYQTPPHAEAKLVRCERGAVYDVVVDVRPESPTHGQWFAIELHADVPRALYVPPGYAHGYQTLCDDTSLHYLISARYEPVAARGIAYDSPLLAIPWPDSKPIVSPRDAALPVFGDV